MSYYVRDKKYIFYFIFFSPLLSCSLFLSTQTQTDRYRHTHIETQAETHKDAQTEMHRQTEGHTDRHTETHMQTDRKKLTRTP